VPDHGEPLREALALVAPGTPLREGLDRVLQAKRGALVVVGDDPSVLSICTGGFLLDAEFTPQRLSELAKMDGAVILTPDASRIARANVHLMPRASIPTSETGTRHRTAERVARSLDVAVVTVSEAMATVTVYRGPHRHTLQRTGRLVDRASQAISAAERFKSRFDLALALLSTLEVEDTVSVSDVVAVLQPGEMVLRFTQEVEGYLVELGEDGRLIRLQIQELAAGVEETMRLVALDYVVVPELPGTCTDGSFGTHGSSGAGGSQGMGQPTGAGDPWGADPWESTAPGDRASRDGGPRGVAANGQSPAGGRRRGPGRQGGGAQDVQRSRASREQLADAALAALHTQPHEELLGGAAVAVALGFEPGPGVLEIAVEARGYRLLHRLPRVSKVTIERIVERFVTLPRLMQASLADLEKVGGVGEAKARSVKDGLARMVEASILERYE
jgi:DNA integrity scanning protein DisA with diadenylate cyclase activity